MGLFNSRSAAAASSWLLLSLALLILHVQAQRRYIPRRHHIRRISHPNSKMQSASSSFLHPISVPLLPGPILKLPPPPKKFAYATFAPVPAAEDPNDPVDGFIQLVLAKQPLYPPAPYQKPTDPPTTAVPTTEAPTTIPPYTTIKPKTLNPYVRPAPTTAKPYVRPAPTTSKPYVRPAPTTAKPYVRPAPTTAKPYVRPPPKTAKPYVRPPPPTAKPYGRPYTTRKTVKPTKKPYNPFPKVTKAIPAPTSSATSTPVPLDSIVDVRGVGGEMMKLGATKSQKPVSLTDPASSAVTAPASIATAAPARVPSATTAPAPIITNAPATEAIPTETEAPEEIKGNTPVPLAFASFRPYQRPFYRPAVYTRPPFRQHLKYTLLPKTTEAPATSEIVKLDVDERSSVSTSTEVEPEIVTEKEEDTVPAPFDDFEMSKILPDVSEQNAIPTIDEEPNLSESLDFPPVLPEESAIVVDPEEPIIAEDDLKTIEDIESVPEEVIKSVPDEPNIVDVIPDEPEILEFIPDEPAILEIIPEEPESIEFIPADLAVVDFVPDEPNIVEIIPEVPTNFEDFPKEFEVFEPELVDPQIVEAEKILPVINEEFAFDFNIPETANEIEFSTEEIETDELDFEIGSISEDVTEAIPVAVEVPKIIEDESISDFVAPQSPETLKVFEPIPALVEEIEEDSPVTDLPESQEIVTTVEIQPFKRSHKYEPVWNIHTFGHGDKNSPPRSQSYPGWPELSSTTRQSHDYPTWLQSTTSSPFARNAPDWPQDVTTHRGYVFSKWSPKLENDKKTTTDTWWSEKPFSPETKTIESTTKKSSEENTRLNHLKNVRKSRRRFRTSTVKPTTSIAIKSTTVKTPGRSTIFPSWDEIQTRKASRERTSSEFKETNIGLDTGFGSGSGTGFGFGDWGSKI